MRLGFACTVLGIDVPAHDARRPQNGPHLCTSLGYVQQILRYAGAQDIRMYRLSSNIAPYYTDPNRPQFGNQLAEAADDLAATGALARALDIRLSSHPGQYTVLNSPDPAIVAAALRELQYHVDVLDQMGQPPRDKVILHVGGVYGDKPTALARFIARYQDLPAAIRARLVIENDDRLYTVGDVLAIHEATGVPVVFDNLHHALNPTPGLDERAALAACLATWPGGHTPKTHYSDRRTTPTEVRIKGKPPRLQPPSRGAHADYVDPAAFAAYIQAARGLPDFDVMFEAKAKDQSVLRVMAYLTEHNLWPAA
ncbi:MAG TPA: UV DNA damage repair endonuclease UvsE [Chloroflexia bacterium]|nr:UV DNA damage repair endonuclease UvsE [Chloroflexia bacterium]